ncbi:MAG: PIN domain-containing protein [Myxococcales bacterium]|nr:PIN domain-containing protein [Myxococcales bacterium]
MIAYIDASVLLRKLFGEPGRLAEWRSIESAWSSRLLRIEVARTIDRCRLEGRIDDEQVAVLHSELRRLLRSIEVVAITDAVFQRAAAAMPTVVGTLDAIHLATALAIGAEIEGPIVLATHDGQLARAARASGLDVVGV